MALFFYQFTPLYGHNRGFTDKVGFLDHLSVKPGSKRLKSYGQTTIFNNFVRKRHFLSRRFTDKALIFIDMSVNGKCSTRSISTSRRDYGQSAVLELFVRNQAKISLEFTDKALIFDDLSVSKTHFTDKQGIFNDLFVNFWPL